MNWFKKALTICTSEPNRYYTSIDPLTFYEWRFTQSIPSGVKFSNKLPRSESFMDGQLIVSAYLPESALQKVENKFELKNEVAAEVSITAGTIASPSEIIEKYNSLSSSYSRNLESFKHLIKTQRFFISSEEEPKLYKVETWDNNSAVVSNFGEFAELVDKFSATMQELQKNASSRTGRAFELENVRKFENYMMFLKADNQLVDATKLSFLINVSGISGFTPFKITWEDLYLKSSKDAKNTSEFINSFNKLSWVKYTSEYLNTIARK